MLDIVITGGLAVLPSGPEQADIGVAGGRISAIGAPGSLAALGAGRTVDASGQIVIPGGIDPHVHCRWPIVVPGDTQHQLTDGLARVSQAASSELGSPSVLSGGRTSGNALGRSRAARHEHTTVTRHIHVLEDELNNRLFHERNSGYELTETGERLVAGAGRIEGAYVFAKVAASSEGQPISGNDFACCPLSPHRATQSLFRCCPGMCQ